MANPQGRKKELNTQTWSSIHSIQSKFIVHFNNLMSLQYKRTDSEGRLHFEIKKSNPLAKLRAIGLKAFKKSEVENICYLETIFHNQIDQNPHLTENDINPPIQSENTKYKSFSGQLLLKKTVLETLIEQTGIKALNDNCYGATLTQIENFDRIIKNFPDVERSPQIVAIFKMRPSLTYLRNEFDKAVQLLSSEMPKLVSELKFTTWSLAFRNKFLHPKIATEIATKTPYKHIFHRLVYTINPKVFLQFEENRKKHKIFFLSEDTHNLEGYLYPDPIGNEFIFIYPNSVSNNQIIERFYQFQKEFQRVFGSENVVSKHEHVFKMDIQVFYNELNRIIDPYFKLSIDKETIAFEFKDKPEFYKNLTYLQGFDAFKIDFIEEFHAFKIHLNIINSINKHYNYLLSIDGLTVNMSDNCSSLFFYGFSDDLTLLQNIENQVFSYFQNTHPSICLSYNQFYNGFFNIKTSFWAHEIKYHADNEYYYQILENAIAFDREGNEFGLIETVNFPALSILPSAQNTTLMKPDEMIEVTVF